MSEEKKRTRIGGGAHVEKLKRKMKVTKPNVHLTLLCAGYHNGMYPTNDDKRST